MAQPGLETFKLSELRLDEENYRLGHQDGQREALLAMINEQRGKLANLARDIIQMDGISPGEPLWVMKDPELDGQYIVVEGNRRITALKLMENPTLAESTEVEKHFKNLAVAFAKKPIRQFEAKVFSSRDEVRPWLRRRHLSEASGVGIQGWKPQAKARADRAQGLGAPRFLAVIQLLGNDTDEWNIIYDSLDRRWTTVDRVLNTKALGEILGITIDLKTGAIRFENGDTRAGRAVLMRILSVMAAPAFKFDKIEKVGDREKFIAEFADGSVKAKPTKKGPPPKAAVFVPPKTPVKPIRHTPSAAKPSDAPRATLAPKLGARVFKVEGVRLQSLYRECRNIPLAKNENAAALLLRVFIELSSEAVLVNTRVPVPQKHKERQRLRWSDRGIPLDDKIVAVCEHFDKKGTSKDFQQVRVALDTAGNASYSITTLHGYFHNLDLIPEAAALRSAWDAWEVYLRIIHEAMLP